MTPPREIRTHPFFDRVGETSTKLAKLAEQLRDHCRESGDPTGAGMAETLRLQLTELARSTLVETQPIAVD